MSRGTRVVTRQGSVGLSLVSSVSHVPCVFVVFCVFETRLVVRYVTLFQIYHILSFALNRSDSCFDKICVSLKWLEGDGVKGTCIFRIVFEVYQPVQLAL